MKRTDAVTRRPAVAVAAAGLCLAAVTVSALTSCSTGADVSATARASTGFNSGSGSGRDLTWAEDLRVSDAEQHLITQCMRRHGFRFQDERRPGLAESRPLGYVQDDVNWARTYGYGSRITAQEDRARLANPNVAYRKALSPDRQRAFDTAMDGGTRSTQLRTMSPTGGTITKMSGGCTGEAEKRLYGDPARWFRTDTTVSNLRPLYVNKLLKDGEFTRAVHAWSACMRRAGHPYRDPAAARQSTREHDAERTPAEEARGFTAETRLAVADATCARSVHLRTIGERREAHYVDQLTGKYGAQLDLYRRIKQDALTRAEKTVPART
ncbi:hypothetical protein KUM39_14000 [Streptomyces sp. J2-1]|uniref:hypothetical protein n=1 Tax=Streptomyces corallincola TaxID=2851888 RepID=UPI001C3937E9|nr:hypothetical protein [Streptomyces corallincola]MBV2355467.1 hypothetical protein [Streptomyces corallincola]